MNIHHLHQGLKDERGQGMAEYGLLLSLISLVCAVATQTFGANLTASLTTTASSLI